MNVIAEGIETQQQLAFLREKGCPEGQGYYFSKPMLADELAEFLRDSAKVNDRTSKLAEA